MNICTWYIVVYIYAVRPTYRFALPYAVGGVDSAGRSDMTAGKSTPQPAALLDKCGELLCT